MSGLDWKRREFVRVLLSLPLGYVVGCRTDSSDPVRTSLRRLVFAFGPWSERERETAEEFAGRFLAAEHLVGLYLPERSGVIRSLADRFSHGSMAVGGVDLAGLSADERTFVLQFVEQLYSLIEVRFYVAREPRWGACLGERTQYREAPA